MKMFHKKVVIIALLLTGCSLICANAPDGNSGGKPEKKNITDTTSSTTAAPTIPTPAPTTPTIPTLAPPTPNTDTTTTSTTPAPQTTPSTTTTTTTVAPQTTPSTTTTTTTVAPPMTPSTTTTTTTVAPPTTPSTTTTTTTAAPPTTPSTTSTTVAPPTTSTTIAPVTTTPKPTPYPDPSIVQWNSSCILVKMAAQLNITYKTKDNRNATALYNIPSTAMENDASCDNLTQTIQINWGAADAQDSMLLQFELKEKTAELTMMRFIISIVGDRFPNAMENQTIQLLHRGNDFKVPAQMSYHCTRAQRFNLTETVPEKESVGFVVMRDVQVESFRMPSNSTVFAAAHDCDSSDTPDIVPIAVGIALAAMIMIILTAYLCARRRSTSRGYMSF